jgi:plastocyanin
MLATRLPMPPRNGRCLLVGAFAASVLLAGATPTSAASSLASVEIHNFQFVPATLTVTAGTIVTWTNDDTTPHTVTEQNRLFHSAGLDTKDTFTYKFTTPGEFVYRCTFHPMMVGKIVVKPAGKSS